MPQRSILTTSLTVWLAVDVVGIIGMDSAVEWNIKLLDACNNIGHIDNGHHETDELRKHRHLVGD